MTVAEWAMQGGDYSTLAGVKAGADLSAASNFGKVVKFDSSNDVVLRGSSGTGVGILGNKPSSGQAACVVDLGPCEIQVDGSGTAITPQLEMTVNTASRLIVATAGDIVYAYSGGSSSAAGDIIAGFAVKPYKKSA